MENNKIIYPGDEEEVIDRVEYRDVASYKDDDFPYRDERKDDPDLLITVRNEIKKIIKDKYPTFPIHELDISDILKDSFIHHDEMRIKDFILRLLVLEKIFQLSISNYKTLENSMKRVENHLETIRRNMITLTKKIDVQTGRIYFNGFTL
ncbi:SPV114 putative fusion protein [Swinepox virus]|uniref:Envelope protein p35 n=5 Tax=Swinepox virus TaxID=10276 RepID=A0A3G2M0M6_SWPV